MTEMAADARTAANGCVRLAACAAALLSTVTIAHPQTDRTRVDRAILEAVALLIHGRYGEEPYQLTETSSGTAVVQETSRRSLRFVVRPVAGSSCVFRATFETVSGLNIEQLDFAKFDGSREIVRACGDKGTMFESSCSAGLRFGQQPGNFCQYIFNSDVINLENLSFPNGACRYFAYGAYYREADLARYVAAFDRVYRRCAASIERQAKPPQSHPDE